MNIERKAGLLALTVEAEQKELSVVTFPPEFIGSAYKVRPHKIKFAFFQSDFQGGKIPYWHVVDPASKNYQSTLSMRGLRDWGIL